MAVERRREAPFKDAKPGTCKWCGEPICYGRVRQRSWHDGREPPASLVEAVRARGIQHEIELVVAEPDCLTLFNAGASQQGARSACFKRDRGVCAGCGVDVHELEQQWDRDRSAAYDRTHPPRDEGFYRRLSWEARCRIYDAEAAAYQDWLREHPQPRWYADHVVPLWDGGELELTNLQTLCEDCHGRKTREEAAERARRRRPPEQGVQMGMEAA